MKAPIFIAMTFAALMLQACGSDTSQDASFQSPEMMPPAPMVEAPVEGSMMGTRASKSAGMNDGIESLPNQSGLYLAYTYHRSITVPGDDLETLLQSHASTCVSAGPENCLVTSSGLNGLETEYANGSLNIRATPDWTNSFLGNLSDSLTPLKAEISHASTSAVDLTTQLIDTNAQLKAQTTLRDRLQNLLETRDGDLNELLSVERELSRVQSQIDRYESTLANLKQRVSMSTITLQYSAKASVVSRSVWQPLLNAFGDFFSHVAFAMAFVVSLIAYGIILLPVLFGLVWLGLWGLRKIRSKKSNARTNDAPSS